MLCWQCFGSGPCLFASCPQLIQVQFIFPQFSGWLFTRLRRTGFLPETYSNFGKQIAVKFPGSNLKPPFWTVQKWSLSPLSDSLKSSPSLEVYFEEEMNEKQKLDLASKTIGVKSGLS